MIALFPRQGFAGIRPRLITLLSCTLWASTLAALLAASGCAPIPQKEFHTYRDAFGEANQAAQAVVLDYGAAKAEFCRRAAAKGKPQATCTAEDVAKPDKHDGPTFVKVGYPATYASELKRQPPSANSAQERLRALTTIDRYNQLLADLADGKSVQELSAATTSLVSAVESLTQAIPGLGAFASNLISVAEKARTRAEFVNALKSGEKPVAGILEFLVADASDYYDLRRTLADEDISLVRERISNRVAAMMALVSARKADPSDEELEEISKGLNVALGKIGGIGGATAGVKLVPAASGAALDKVALTELSTSLNEIEQDVALHEAIVEKMRVYNALLQKYEKLLLETRQAMATLRVAIDSPADAAQQFEDVFHTVLSLKSDLAQLRANF